MGNLFCKFKQVQIQLINCRRIFKLNVQVKFSEQYSILILLDQRRFQIQFSYRTFIFQLDSILIGTILIIKQYILYAVIYFNVTKYSIQVYRIIQRVFIMKYTHLYNKRNIKKGINTHRLCNFSNRRFL
ncbi:transmembrane protein, putative (macronuclear) [Tetrahymena thermophila SB210]|uniref:Transmembrane protein, putative n=1 Tax=Tetrahymena thermophila (strain SB210) TaxID=312017 RepID=W7XCD8_TETTS|nr:transmembrane protein, putative [Tetrahymena thermophila SB210]EWS75102.1 transmembrane protein, putative [Tetrahymena thermophila SB210]|eukprot:XP_012652340.1 transmembrane protein, putative [Tetrahymena thermophila SB210]